MASPTIRPHLVVADEQGNIYDHPDLLLLCRRGDEMALPRPDELMPLPDESDLFLLPKRRAVGLDPESGEAESLEEVAVAAFVSPAHTITAHPAYISDKNAPTLPLFAYGAVGYARGKFYVCAKRVDEDNRQVFKGISAAKIKKNAHAIMEQFPKNRLMQHLMAKCALTYGCPAAKNLSIGRHEAPLPTSRACNARCIGCISKQERDSKICSAPQNRLAFTPTAKEIVEVMEYHARHELDHPVFSFGQGCEGEPLTESPLLIEAITTYRARGGRGTINMNSNASMPDAVAKLAEAGLTSMRVSLNSARDETYKRYYRPQGYGFEQVRQSIKAARKGGVFVSLNLLFFPGVTDTEPEVQALVELIRSCGVSFIQLRNLNIDPEMYMELVDGIEFGACMGLVNFRKRLRRQCPWLKFGYFNPYLGDKAEIEAPMPDTYITDSEEIKAAKEALAEKDDETLEFNMMDIAPDTLIVDVPNEDEQ